MGMIIARRNTKDISLFDYFFRLLIKACNPDEVWISSGFYSNHFWNTGGNAREPLRDLLRDKRVVLVADKRSWSSSNIENLKMNLQKDLGAGSEVKMYVHDDKNSYLRSNEIQLFKNGRDVAGIVGSSSCKKKDLEWYNNPYKPEDNTDFDIQSDMVYFDSSFDDSIINIMSARDSELSCVSPELLTLEIFGIDSGTEMDIPNTNLKGFVTRSGLFHEVL